MRHLRHAAVAGLVLAASLVPAAADTSGAPGRDGSQWGCDDWGMYGRTLARRFSTEGCEDHITATNVATLVPAWTLPFRPALVDADDLLTFTASPVVVGDTVYVGGWDGFLYALDKETGAKRWEFETAPAPGATFGPIVSSAAVVDHKGERWVIFGSGPRVYAVADVRLPDGRRQPQARWVSYVGALDASGKPLLPEDPAEVESSPVVWNGTVYVGMDVHDQYDRPDEVRTAGVRGGLLALNLQNGAVRWKYEPEKYGRGLDFRGDRPAGGCGGVWSSPAVDTARRRIYVATANCYTATAENEFPLEELAALDLDGKPVWRFFPHDPGDDNDLRPGSDRNDDVDFGATPNLFGDVVGIGNKDGRYYVVDADATGVLRKDDRRVRASGYLSRAAPNVGGFIGSTAAHGRNVFGGTAIGTVPGYHSLSVDAPETARWQAPVAPTYAGSAATRDVAFAGALDGVFRAFHAGTGLVLWASPLFGPVSSAPAVVGDMVFVGSGTSTSDLCAKENPWDPACRAAFETVLGQQGGVHAFRLAAP